jgi:hypothetical protein
MPLQNGIHSIIHKAGDINLSAFTYTQVYAGVAAAPVINGTTVNMPAGTTIDILLRTISGALTNVYAIGDKISTTDPGGTTGVIL